MKVLYIATECKPFSKVGGIGDVAGALPPELKRQGIDIEVATPLYAVVPTKYVGPKQAEFTVYFNRKRETVGIFEGKLGDVPVHFVKNAAYFEGPYGKPYIDSTGIPFIDDILRFSFFSEACLHLIRLRKPDIVHVNDWPLCFLFGRMVQERLQPRRILTIHNVGYQGNVGKDAVRDLDIGRLLTDEIIGSMFIDPRPSWNSVNPLKMGMELAHMTNTVSPTYCMEITQPEDIGRFFEGGKGLHHTAKKLYEAGRLVGILNGFEYEASPETRPFERMLARKQKTRENLTARFTNPDGFLMGFVGRAVEQKFRLLSEQLAGLSVLEHILALPNMNIAVLAAGEPEYESFIRKVKHRGNFLPMIGFDEEKAGQISLGSDVFLMPSLFEPCGIAQMKSLSTATPPLVRWTGGLADTVVDYRKRNGTGFGFDGSNRREVLQGLIDTVRAAEAFLR
ncbi:MAG TPA: glycogen/starch synthase, partial [bacterium]